MTYAMSHAKITFQYNVALDCTAGVNAAANIPANASWQDAANVGGFDVASPPIPTISDTGQQQFLMTICPLMMSRQVTLSTTNQSLIGTFIHEFSHMIANTFDRKVPSNNSNAYGSRAFTLAQESPMRASQNAENYGFFCAYFKK